MNFRNFIISLICAVLGIILSWQYKSIVNNNLQEGQQKIRLETVKDDLIVEKEKREGLEAKLKDLEKQKKEYEDRMGNSGQIEAALKKELDTARLVAGLTDVKGKGIVITIDNTSVGEVADSDILNIINELKAAEAQAISVNNERIVSSSEVRKAGNYIVVNTHKITRPYVIKAIAEPSKLERALDLVGGVAESFKEIYKIQYNIEKKDEVYIPKVDMSIIKSNQLTIVD